jgi:flagellar hook-basal body complex protein FliE
MADGMKIGGIDALRAGAIDAKSMRPAAPSGTVPAKSFQSFLTDTVTEVQRLQSEADQTIKKLVSGQIKDVGEAMVAVEKADLSFQTMMTVRTRVMAAYDDIMRMQV